MRLFQNTSPLMQTNNVLYSITGFNTSIERRAPSTATD